MSKHTPGPWIVRERWYIGREDTGTFAEVKCCEGLPADAEETHEANACLIAAAPELLEAAKVAASVLEANMLVEMSEKMAHQKLLTAIAKAEGNT